VTVTRLPPGPHLDLLMAALVVESDAQRALLAGDRTTATAKFGEAAQGYRESFNCAPPHSYGRLVGMLKAAIIAGNPAEAARFARAALVEADATPTSGYASAIAALVVDDAEAARAGAALMSGGDARFGRAARAASALADGDPGRYAQACRDIVADFAARTDHLTGVAIADTAVMFEILAAERGMACHPASPLMPPV
jgi:hypothetical protein